MSKQRPGFNIRTALDVIHPIMDDQGQIGKEHGMYVARTSEGRAIGIGTSYVSCIINTARVLTHSKQPYDMSFAGGH